MVGFYSPYSEKVLGSGQCISFNIIFLTTILKDGAAKSNALQIKLGDYRLVYLQLLLEVLLSTGRKLLTSNKHVVHARVRFISYVNRRGSDCYQLSDKIKSLQITLPRITPRCKHLLTTQEITSQNEYDVFT